ncbi:unnamed protein product [Bursaphelenchus xylophilus]|uniref:(pine wood nematode) hypothetical protein n=1 Tax=Bursaphelenchus xylophilus TaxID=6326 RepID=A0A1I7S6E4_BURXY|nr:unnamed protein product [Bursaphelenchus xylophilus]CAG9128075.1 unnamed protein product [Bursaphelenchus xylophilus]
MSTLRCQSRHIGCNLFSTTFLLILPNICTAWLNGYNNPYNNFAPRFRSGGGYGGGSYGNTPYGNGDEENREIIDERYGAPCNPNAFSVPTNCLGNNMVKALKNLAHVPPGSNTTFIPLGQVLIPTGKEMTFCRPNNNNCGSFQGPSNGMQPGPDCCPDYCPNDGCGPDFDGQQCCGPCCYRRRYFALHRRRRSLHMQRRFFKLENSLKGLKKPKTLSRRRLV